jgi:hypothetical protein
MTEHTALSGIKEITAFCGSIGLPRSDVSILKLHHEEGLPMKKLGGIWESDKDLIVEWRKRRINDMTVDKPETKQAKRKRK